MSDNSFFSSVPIPDISPLTTQADKVLGHAPDAATENNKIEKSAKDFEAILLSNWLQQAEQSFGSVPGGDDDDDDDADPGKGQLQGIAMQSLGNAMTAAGGIGIARMIATQLHKTSGSATADCGKLHPRGD